DHLGLVAEFACQRAAKQGINGGEESGEGLAGAGGGGDERIAAGGDRGPALRLGLGGGAEPLREPRLHYRVKRSSGQAGHGLDPTTKKKRSRLAARLLHGYGLGE